MGCSGASGMDEISQGRVCSVGKCSTQLLGWVEIDLAKYQTCGHGGGRKG